MKHHKYPSIGQFRNVIRGVVDSAQMVLDESSGEYVRDVSKPIPTLKFTGTVKAHGTNAGICVSASGEQYAMSRNNVITPENDNAGFAQFAECRDTKLFIKLAQETIRRKLPDLGDQDLCFYGEWCGGSIQKGVALNQLENKIWIIFGVKVISKKGEDNWWLDFNNLPLLTVDGARVYDARAFGGCEVSIDFNSPELSSNLLQELTLEVEKECPIGRYFGVSGVGEGIVYSHRYSDGSVIQFKVKGEKHSVSKVKTLVPVDVEKVKSINAFVEYAVTEARLSQAANETLMVAGELDFNRKNLGTFIKWVSSDIVKEELDVLSKNGLEMKDVGSPLSKAARNWFFSKEVLAA